MLVFFYYFWFLLFVLKYFFIYAQDYYLVLLTLLNVLSLNILLLIIVYSIALSSIYPIISCMLLLNLKLFSINHVTILFYDLPLSLNTGFLTIHPCLFYFTLLSLPIILTKLSSWLLLFLLRNIIITGFLALIFGMYWGVYSNLWGYFWVQDIIEWLLFYLIILSLLIYHLNFVKNYSVLSYLIYILFILLILSLRLNLFETRHSFFLAFYLENFLLYCFFSLNYLYCQTLVYASICCNQIFSELAISYGLVIYSIIKFNFWLLKMSKKLLILHLLFLLFFLTWVQLTYLYFGFYTLTSSIVFLNTNYFYNTILETVSLFFFLDYLSQWDVVDIYYECCANEWLIIFFKVRTLGLILFFFNFFFLIFFIFMVLNK